MRRGTLIAVIVLFVLLVGAAIYQLALGSRNAEPLCGPSSPGALPSPGTCRTTLTPAPNQTEQPPGGPGSGPSPGRP